MFLRPPTTLQEVGSFLLWFISTFLWMVLCEYLKVSLVVFKRLFGWLYGFFFLFVAGFM